MKKLISTLMCVLVLATCGEKKEEAANEKPIVKIGLVVPLTGELSAVTNGFKSAVKMADEDLKMQNLKNKYVFLFEDDAFEAKRTLSAFNKLANVDQIDAVLSFGSQGGGIISPLTEAKHIIHINIGASEMNVAEGKYNFIHWTLPSSTTKKLLDFYRKKGYKKIAVATPYNSGTLAIKEAFKKNLAGYPEIEADYFDFQPNEKDFRLLLAKIKETSPDVVLTLAYGNNQIPFLKQYHEAQMPFLLTNSESFALLSDYSAAEGVYYTDVATNGPEMLERAKRYYSGTNSFGLGNTYDAIMLLVQMFEQSDTTEQAVDTLRKVKEYDGAIGHLVQDEKGIFHSQAVLKKVINGKPVMVEE